MSFFYSLGIKVSFFIEKTFKNSKLFVLIFKIMLSVEKSFLNSYFKNIYPSNDFISFLRRSKILNNHLFHPFCFLIIFSIFLMISKIDLSFELKFTLFLAFISFIGGVLFLPMCFLKVKIKISLLRLIIMIFIQLVLSVYLVVSYLFSFVLLQWEDYLFLILLCDIN